MIEELVHKYQVSRKLARTWVEIDQILPLLDGLDEVATENRTKCIETINTYHQKHPFLPLVVTSRSADYLAQTERVRLASAVTIRSLTRQQVDDYLASGGEPLWALQVALHQDAALRELTETPLMLSILTLTYHDMPVEDLLRGGITPTRQQIFEHYVERMLSRRGTTPSYSSLQTRGWLAWLARQMKQQSQTVFYLERLQPDWLGDRHRRLLYRLSVGPVVGLFVWLFVWLIGALVVGLIGALVVGLFDGLIIGLIAMLSFGLGPFFQHFALRFWLWRSRAIPWNYPRFLDYTTEHILLSKVGGGYIFVHRLLLDYFASLDTTSTPDAARAKR